MANQAGDTNYSKAAPVSQSITVNRHALTVTASNATKIYGTTNPSFTGTVTGAVNGNTFAESFTTNATVSSPVGNYPIVPSVTGSNLSNYAVTIDDGTLTVTQAASTTTLTTNSTTILSGHNLTLTAQAQSTTSGTPTGSVNFYDGTSLLNTTTLTNGTASYTTATLAGGPHTLIAVYSGDTNFIGSNSGTPIPVTITLLDFSITVSGPSSQTVVPGSAVNYHFMVTPLNGAYPSTVNFAVSGLPAGATGTFSPGNIAANGGTQTVMLTVQTAPATAGNTISLVDRKVAPVILGLLLLPLAGARRLRRTGRTMGRMLCLVLLLLGGAIGAGVLSGCGSNNGFLGQASANYTITATATSGTLQHTSAVNLNLQ